MGTDCDGSRACGSCAETSKWSCGGAVRLCAMELAEGKHGLSHLGGNLHDKKEWRDLALHITMLKGCARKQAIWDTPITKQVLLAAMRLLNEQCARAFSSQATVEVRAIDAAAKLVCPI